MVNLRTGNKVRVKYNPLKNTMYSLTIELSSSEYFSISQNFKSLANPRITCQNDISRTDLDKFLTNDDKKSIHYYLVDLGGVAIPIKRVEDIQFYE